jgi:hypothetical protein
MATGESRRSVSRQARGVETRLNDPSVYLRMRGFTGTVVLECVACPTHFTAKDGLAFPAVEKNGEAVMAAFCCARCYLQAMPLTLMSKA